MQLDAEHLINKVPEGGHDKEMILKTSGGKIFVCFVLRETELKNQNKQTKKGTFMSKPSMVGKHSLRVQKHLWVLQKTDIAKDMKEKYLGVGGGIILV